MIWCSALNYCSNAPHGILPNMASQVFHGGKLLVIHTMQKTLHALTTTTKSTIIQNNNNYCILDIIIIIINIIIIVQRVHYAQTKYTLHRKIVQCIKAIVQSAEIICWHHSEMLIDLHLSTVIIFIHFSSTTTVHYFKYKHFIPLLTTLNNLTSNFLSSISFIFRILLTTQITYRVQTSAMTTKYSK